MSPRSLAPRTLKMILALSSLRKRSSTRLFSAARLTQVSKTGERLDRVLTKLGMVSEANLADALCKFLVPRPGAAGRLAA